MDTLRRLAADGSYADSELQPVTVT
jgi:hypothetical protein